MSSEWLIRWKPSVGKKTLLFIAGILWMLAGCILLFRGIFHLINDHYYLLISLSGGAVGGILFYRLVFARVSNKYIRRILHLENDRPCVFSFFSWKSYLIMAFMISMGIFLGKRFLPPHELHVFFVIMSIPLITSGLRFIKHGVDYLQPLG
ncbi:MAG: hypothetical protein NTU44_15820 [Bacteroidetes bacterium]|nr:hypothetical protein [Bacteroidota bacterium]